MRLDLSKGSRERLLAIITLGVMAIFIVRLFFLQVIQHDYYSKLAKGEQVKQLDLPATRGDIYAMDDSTPVPLVLNQTVYTVFADPYVVGKNSNAVIQMVSKYAGGNAVPDIDKLLANKQSQYAIIARNVSYQQAALMKNQNLAGVGFTQGTARVYPEGSLGSQVLGFVNNDGQGQYGVEGYFDQQLAGKDGELKTVTDVRDVPLNVGSDNIDTPAVDGKNVVLTVDRNIQAQTESVMNKVVQQRHIQNASVLVMDPQNGHVLSMANYPSFDPSQYQKVSDGADFNNNTISSPYEPGSDIKTLTATTAVDLGLLTPNSTYDNLGHINVDGTQINNATIQSNIAGNITIQTAMDYSLNTGFVSVAQWLGGENAPAGQAIINTKAQNTMYTYFHDKLHLGEPTHIQLEGETQGTVVPPGAQAGSDVRYANMAFGQGLDATMLQVASAFSCVVNGGTYYSPTILAGYEDADGTTFNPVQDKPGQAGVIKQSTSDTLREMVHNARDKFYGGTDKKGYFVGGKTGTSQALVNGVYSNTQTIGTYLGFGGEIGGPTRYVIMVRVSGQGQNLEGNADAMPIFNDLSNWMISYLKLQPKG